MLALNNIQGGKYAFLQLHYYFTKNKGAAKNEVLNFISSQLLKFSCQMCCTQLIPISSITSISCFSALSEVTTLLSVMTRPICLYE